jgi:hypothetical protein
VLLTKKQEERVYSGAVMRKKLVYAGSKKLWTMLD